MKCVLVLLVILNGATLMTDAVQSVAEITASCDKSKEKCYMGPYCFGWNGENVDGTKDPCDSDKAVINKINCKFGFGTFKREGDNIKVQLAVKVDPAAPFAGIVFNGAGAAVKLESVADSILIVACVGVPKTFVGIGKLEPDGKTFKRGEQLQGDTKLDGDWIVCEFTLPANRGLSLAKGSGGSYNVGIVQGKSAPKGNDFELTDTKVYSSNSNDPIDIFKDLGNKMEEGKGPSPSADGSSKFTVGFTFTLVILGLVM